MWGGGFLSFDKYDMEKINRSFEQERSELNALINRGVSFDVQDVEVQYKPYLWGLFKKKLLVPITRNFIIEEPTLGTLDRLSSEWVEMAIDEEAIKGDDDMLQARKMTKRHALRCAKVIALAVLGTDYLIPKASKGGGVRYVEDVARLDELTALFARSIKPSELYQLCVLINAMCNLGDFLNSIRLMSADRTTMPIRIEGNSEG